MDHPCYKCGHSIEDGKAFCSQCGAPQIRVVVVAEPVASVVAEIVSSAELPAVPQDARIVPGVLRTPALSAGVEWPQALRASAVAALISGLVMAFGLMVPLLAGLGAGFLAVSLYHRRNPAWGVNARSGAQVGALSGLLFFGISAVLKSLDVAIFHTGWQVRQAILAALQQAASRSNDPQVQAVIERLGTPEGFATVFIFFLLMLFGVSIAAGSLAGALTGAILGRRSRP